MIEIKRELRGLIRDVLEGRADKGRGAVAGQLFNALLRTVETECRVHEQEVIGERLDRVEEVLARAKRREQEESGDYTGRGWRGR